MCRMYRKVCHRGHHRCTLVMTVAIPQHSTWSMKVNLERQNIELDYPFPALKPSLPTGVNDIICSSHESEISILILDCPVSQDPKIPSDVGFCLLNIVLVTTERQSLYLQSLNPLP